MRLLIAEDDPILADGLVRSMEECGYVTDWVANGEDADNVLRQELHDLLILDLGLPRINGIQILERLRSRKNKIPVLIITAKGALEDRIRGLDLGADDYLPKPFDLPELEARVRALIRRVHGNGINELTMGELCFDTKGRRITVEGKPLDLSDREMSVFETLLRRAGKVVSKEQILENLCNWNEEVSDNAIEVYIHRLRKKLGACRIVIRTVRGLGYLMDPMSDD